jgi:hypothetical protein
MGKPKSMGLGREVEKPNCRAGFGRRKSGEPSRTEPHISIGRERGLSMSATRLLPWTACLGLLFPAAPASACGFIDSALNVVTLRESAGQARLILYGTLSNAREGGENGRTDLFVLHVLKDDPFRGGLKVLTIPRYIPIADPKSPPQFLIFADVHKGEYDFFKGASASSAIVEYLRGLLAIEARDRLGRLRYCFDFLEHEDPVIAKDAHDEFIKSPDPYIRAAGMQLSPEPLRQWLREPNTPPDRQRLYAYLLANCGEAKDAALLRTLLEKRISENKPELIDAILSGYTILAPEAGWAYTRNLLANAKRAFLFRYGAYRSVRYFYTTHPGVVSEKDLVEGMSLLLDQDDFADLLIDDMRRWKCWKLSAKVIGVYAQLNKIPCMRRSIIAYALQCPDVHAANFVADLRRTNAELVGDIEEGLHWEAVRKRTIQ